MPEPTPLLIGMTVDVNVVVSLKENALLLPVSAVEGNAVYVVDGADKRTVANSRSGSAARARSRSCPASTRGEGSFASLNLSGNNILVGDRMAERLGASLGTTVSVVSSTGLTRSFKIVGLFHSGVTARDEGEAFVLLRTHRS